MSEKRIALGRITGAHGLTGDIRIATFTAAAEGIASYGPLTDDTGATHRVTQLRPTKGGVIARLAGVADRTAAEALAGRMLFVARDRLPVAQDDEFYHADLIGLAARTADGHPYGEIVAVPNFGASDMLEIRIDGERATVLIPFTRANVPRVDIAGGCVIVVPPEYEGATD